MGSHSKFTAWINTLTKHITFFQMQYLGLPPSQNHICSFWYPTLEKVYRTDKLNVGMEVKIVCSFNTDLQRSISEYFLEVFSLYIPPSTSLLLSFSPILCISVFIINIVYQTNISNFGYLRQTDIP